MANAQANTYNKFRNTEDMKNIISAVAGSLAFRSASVMSSKGYRELQGWGSGVESFEALLFIYTLDDPVYKKKINQIKKDQIWLYNPKTRYLYFRLYNRWFSLLCRQMVKFGIYPAMMHEEDDSENPEYVGDDDW